MLNIYTGKEDIDKQRYVFSQIRRQDLDTGRKQTIFLIVPDQFTLETERSAFEYMEAPAFINPVVLSMSRLAVKVLAETGVSTEHIDRYGNYMLLARLLYRNKDGLELYRGLEKSTTFISQLSEAIMNLKSHMVEPEALTKCAAEWPVFLENDAEIEEGSVLLGRKLRDVSTLYSEYEATLSKNIPDSTDIIRKFAQRITDSKILANAIIWVYGFDYFSPLNLTAVGAMACRAAEVNVALTAEIGNPFFSLTNGMAEALAEAAEKAGAKAEIKTIQKDSADRQIACSYLPDDKKPAEVAHIEKELFSGQEVRQFLFKNFLLLLLAFSPFIHF